MDGALVVFMCASIMYYIQLWAFLADFSVNKRLAHYRFTSKWDIFFHFIPLYGWTLRLLVKSIQQFDEKS